MKHKKFISLFVIFTGLFMILSAVFFISSCSSKEEAISDKIDYPAYQTFLNDYTNTLTEEWKTKTLQLIESVEKETTCEIAVAIIDKLNGISIEEYAVELFNEWGVGKKEKDNGVLLLVAMDDHELRIEVGYGLEGVITDLEAGEIINDVIVPRFKENDYDSGIYNGVVAIANKIYKEQGKAQVAYADTVKSVPEKGFADSRTFQAVILPLIIVFIVLLPWLIIGGAIGVTFLKYFITTHKCPECHRVGLSIKQTILVKPTYESPGRVETEQKCRYCGFYEKKTSTISRLFKSSGSGTGSSGFSSSSSSSSHSSSSSSSGSFGGGSSGGGGASGKW